MLTKDRNSAARIGDVRIEIGAIDEVLPGATPVSHIPARRRTSWLPGVALAVLALAIGAWEVTRTATVEENPLANATFSRITNWEGTEEHAEISPDGRFVAFLADRAGQLDVWMSQVGTGQFDNLTGDIAPLLTPGNLCEASAQWRRGRNLVSRSGNPTGKKYSCRDRRPEPPFLSSHPRHLVDSPMPDVI